MNKLFIVTLIFSLTLFSCNILEEDVKSESSSGSNINISLDSNQFTFNDFEVGYKWIYEFSDGTPNSDSIFYNWNDTVTIVEKFNNGDTLYYVREILSGASVWEESKGKYLDTLILFKTEIINSPVVIGPWAWGILDIFTTLDENLEWKYDSTYSEYISQINLGDYDINFSVNDTSKTDIYNEFTEYHMHFTYASYSNKFGILYGGGGNSENGKFKYKLLEVNFLKDEFEKQISPKN